MEAVLFKCGELCQISSADDVVAFLSMSFLQKMSFYLLYEVGGIAGTSAVLQCQILKMSDLFERVML